jgi:hypothetical protein
LADTSELCKLCKLCREIKDFSARAKAERKRRRLAKNLNIVEMVVSTLIDFLLITLRVKRTTPLGTIFEQDKKRPVAGGFFYVGWL